MSWAADGQDENGVQLEKIGPFFQVTFSHHHITHVNISIRNTCKNFHFNVISLLYIFLLLYVAAE